MVSTSGHKLIEDDAIAALTDDLMPGTYTVAIDTLSPRVTPLNKTQWKTGKVQFKIGDAETMATIVVPGFNNLFHVSHLSFTQWLAVIVGSFLIVVLVEIVKATQRALGKDKDAI